MNKKNVAILLLCVLVLTGCKGDPIKQANKEDAKIAETMPKVSELTAEEILSYMSLTKKAAQMVQAERNKITPGEVQAYGIGSVLSGGGSAPADNSPEGWANMYNELQQSATESVFQIPIIYGIDAVHGNNNVYGATIFPHNIGLGATRNPELLYEIGKVTGMEIAATGVDWNFAPCVAVAQDPRWGRYYESYGETPELQTLLTANYIKGLQEYNIVACPKHFLADGGTQWNSAKSYYQIDQGDAPITEEEMRAIHLEGYIQAIEAGADTVMVSFSSINGEKMHANKELVTGLLKEELGFEGFVVSDWEAISQLPGSRYDQIVASINAGVDMLMEPNDWKAVISNIVNAVNNGDITQERVDDAVLRILKVKLKHHLMEEPLVTYDDSLFGTDANKEVARQAARESLVLLKNEDILPLDKGANILLLGPGVDNVGLQCGGWTQTWQGVSEDIVPGTSIMDAFSQMAGANGGKIFTNIEEADSADVVVLIIGEKPYSEGNGDNWEMTLDSQTALSDNEEAMAAALSTGLPIVTVLMAGRPLLVTDELNDWDAFVMAWLPGSEGGYGIADVLYGDFDFSGKLPITWPKDDSQFGYTVVDENYDSDKVLYPYNYGLTYND